MDTVHIIILLALFYLVTRPCTCGVSQSAQHIRTNKVHEGFHGRRDYYGRSDSPLYRDS